MMIGRKWRRCFNCAVTSYRKNNTYFFAISDKRDYICGRLIIKNRNIMNENETTTKNPETPEWTREDVLAWLRRGREIKERRKKELQEWYAEQQRRKKEAMESGYYDIEWV